MFTSVISIPSAASWLLSLRQKAHHVVVYIVSGCATLALPIEFVLDNFTNVRAGRALPSQTPQTSVACGSMSSCGMGLIPGRRKRQAAGDRVHAQDHRAGQAADSPAAGELAEGGPADGPEAVLAGLDPEQRQVALATRGPVCVLAWAGTGKTRAVAHRIAYLAATAQADPARILAVTFTTRAAGELRGRLRQLAQLAPAAGLDKVQARTFHSAALRQLTHFWPSTIGGPAPQVLESKISLVAEAARRLRISAGLPELRDAASEIEWAKV